VFDSLFTTKEVGKGTELRLAIARQIIVEKHGVEKHGVEKHGGASRLIHNWVKAQLLQFNSRSQLSQQL
jgi:C4-dicarboxylate-specific signal transduction histidine kinase